MPSHDTLVLVGDERVFALQTLQNLFLGVIDDLARNGLALTLSGLERSLVDDELKRRTGQSGGLAGQRLQIDVRSQDFSLDVDAQDSQTAAQIRLRQVDLAVKAAGAHERVVKDFRPVRGGHDDDAAVRLEAVHALQDLVQGLFALLVTAAARDPAALAGEAVNLVDEDDAGRLFARFLEEVAHAGRADADEHFHEAGAAGREERYARLAGDSSREQGD